jgi:hypothetical protein
MTVATVLTVLIVIYALVLSFLIGWGLGSGLLSFKKEEQK